MVTLQQIIVLYVSDNTFIFSSPEHEVLRVSYCDHAVSVVRRESSVVNFLPCVRRGKKGKIFAGKRERYAEKKIVP